MMTSAKKGIAMKVTFLMAAVLLAGSTPHEIPQTHAPLIHDQWGSGCTLPIASPHPLCWGGAKWSATTPE
jgi:hypothetical protein